MTAATPPLELDHLVLIVEDVERTLAWYQEHLHLTPVRVDAWRAGDAPFPSLRITEGTIIDVIPGHTAGHAAGHTAGHTAERGHLDHICFTVTPGHMASARAALTVVEEGQRFGARGVASSIYVLDPDGLTVELRVYPPS